MWRIKVIIASWKLGDNVNDWVKSEFARIRQNNYTVESAMSPHLKLALQMGVKLRRLELETEGEKEKGKSWKPDFKLGSFNIPVIIENKLGTARLSVIKESKVKRSIKSIQNFAVSGAIHYAQCAIMNEKYNEVVAVGTVGDSEENVSIKVCCVFGVTDETYKLVSSYNTLDFLENKLSFAEFYKAVTLTEEERHRVLIDSQAKLQEYTKKLNKLMHSHATTAPQRVLYVSGMLLSMQDIADKKEGLIPSGLKGLDLDDECDGGLVVKHINNYFNVEKYLLTELY